MKNSVIAFNQYGSLDEKRYTTNINKIWHFNSNLHCGIVFFETMYVELNVIMYLISYEPVIFHFMWNVKYFPGRNFIL